MIEVCWGLPTDCTCGRGDNATVHDASCLLLLAIIPRRGTRNKDRN